MWTRDEAYFHSRLKKRVKGLFHFSQYPVRLLVPCLLQALWIGPSSFPVRRSSSALIYCIYLVNVFVRSTLRSPPIEAGLKCPSVRPSTKSFFDFNEIWRVGRGRWMMHDSMQYDPIQGQGQGHEPLKVGNPSIFKSYLLRLLQRELATDHWFLN